jgi:hypothetical protein
MKTPGRSSGGKLFVGMYASYSSHVNLATCGAVGDNGKHCYTGRMTVENCKRASGVCPMRSNIGATAIAV